MNEYVNKQKPVWWEGVWGKQYGTVSGRRVAGPPRSLPQRWSLRLKALHPSAPSSAP